MFNIVGGSHGSECTPGGCWHSIITHGYKIGCLMGYGVQNVVLYCQSKSQLLFETSIPCLLPNAQSIYSAKISPSRAKTKLSFRLLPIPVRVKVPIVELVVQVQVKPHLYL